MTILENILWEKKKNPNTTEMKKRKKSYYGNSTFTTKELISKILHYFQLKCVKINKSVALQL
jgi:hypothetical protein